MRNKRGPNADPPMDKRDKPRIEQRPSRQPHPEPPVDRRREPLASRRHDTPVTARYIQHDRDVSDNDAALDLAEAEQDETREPSDRRESRRDARRDEVEEEDEGEKEDINLPDWMFEFSANMFDMTGALKMQSGEIRRAMLARRVAAEAAAAKDLARAQFWDAAKRLIETKYVALTVFAVATILALTIASRYGQIDVGDLTRSAVIIYKGCPVEASAPRSPAPSAERSGDQLPTE